MRISARPIDRNIVSVIAVTNRRDEEIERGATAFGRSGPC